MRSDDGKAKGIKCDSVGRVAAGFARPFNILDLLLA
jgi:hypothetical protein